MDQEIQRLQQQLDQGRQTAPTLERLGWAFVSKARESFDPGYYKIAEQASLCLDSLQPGCAEGLLLRGHVLHNLHRFDEAETIARDLVKERGWPFDYGLLADTLMDQGKLDEAIDACQRMVDLKPDLHSYARAAHLRWLTGDLSGARELMKMAVSAGSPLAPEPTAWVSTRLALFDYYGGESALALQECAAALELVRDYPPALLLRGRIQLAQGKPELALVSLRLAALPGPLPENQWILAEALRQSDRIEEAVEIEAELTRLGPATDPRTCALFLATRGQSPALAVGLAEEELRTRQDIFTHDTLAWALAAQGKLDAARHHMTLALRHGTEDGRLFLHAASIAARSGQEIEARRWRERAVSLQHLLLPSEREQLEALAPIATPAS